MSGDIAKRNNMFIAVSLMKNGIDCYVIFIYKYVKVVSSHDEVFIYILSIE